MQKRKLSSQGPDVTELGFGGWAIGGGWGTQSDVQSVAALHLAIEKGVNLIDTAAGYGDGHSERLIADVIRQRSEEVFIATKTLPSPGPWPPSPYCRWQDRYSAAYLRENLHTRLTNLGPSELICCSFTHGREPGTTIPNLFWSFVACVTKVRSV